MDLKRYGVAGLTCALAMCALVGCPDRAISALPIGQDSVERVELPAELTADLDLLFVIDNSGSMLDEQTSLKNNFTRFMSVLSTIEGGLPNLHVGVVTSDMGTMNGRPFNGCQQFGDDGKLHTSLDQPGIRYLEQLREPVDGVDHNYGGTLDEAFAALAAVETGGCDMEAHLMSMRRALEDRTGFNQGFLRTGAALAVVIIADEDDCSIAEQGQGYFDQTDLNLVHSSYSCFRSSTVCDGPADPAELGPRSACRANEASPFSASVAEMVSFLKALKGEDQLIVAGIVGDPNPFAVGTTRGILTVVPSCQYGMQVARPATRLDAFVRSFRHSAVTSICNEDLAGPLREVGSVIAGTLGSRCFQGEVAEPRSCSVSLVTAAGTPDAQRTPIAECDLDHSQLPCWFIQEDLATCAATETHLALQVDRGGAPAGIGTRLVGECITR